MKNLLFTLFMFLTGLFGTYNVVKAQAGTDCANPHIISSLPFVQAGLTTAGFGNDYTADACGSDYMTGNDYVFTYTPVANQNISIILSNTGPLMVGLFILDDCPDVPAANCTGMNEALMGNPLIDNVALLADTTYYIVVSTYDFFGSNPSTPFDIAISELLPFDGGVTEIISPVTDCGLTASETIAVRIENFGIDSIYNFDVAYSIDGSPPVIEPVTDTIMPGNTLVYTFDSIADFSSSGTTYSITAYSIVTGDGDNSNDTTSAMVTNNITVSAFPYSEDFESGNGYWIAGGDNSSWELGTPNNAIINSAASGVNAWVTNLIGDHNTSENSYVESPCYDFSGLVLPIIEMNVWYETETGILDGTASLDASIDGGATWNTVITWSGSSGGWEAINQTLNGLGGQSNVKLRIFYAAPIAGTGEGFAFDDIYIHESPLADLGVIEIISPQSSCGLTGTEDLTVKIVNYGIVSQSNFDVIYSIDGGANYDTITIADTISPQDTLQFTIIQVDLSTPGVYNLIVATLLTGDEDNSNDTTSAMVTNIITVSAFPYSEDFESGNGFWIAGGDNSSWELGTPGNTIINSAASGVNAWVTNLTGDFNSNENSYVLGPCFDFSTLVLPIIEINIWYESTEFFDSAHIEASTDGGTTWPIVSDIWSGSSGGWEPISQILKSLGGQPNVKLRISFVGNAFLTSEGFAFDDIYIHESPSADLGVIEIISPQSGCGLTGTEDLTVRIANYGINSQSNFNVIYSIDGGANYDTVNIPDIISPQDTTLPLTIA